MKTLWLLGWLAGVASTTAAAQELDTSSTADIEVTGTGKVYAKPDTAIASVGVDVTAPQLADALKQAGDAAAKLVAAVKAQGIDDKDIQTSAYNIYPVTTQPKEGEAAKVTGYRVDYEYNVKVRQLENAGKVMDAAIAAGANSVNGLSFTIDDSSRYETEARAAAVKDAQGKATTLAGAAGVKIGRVISMSEQGGGVQPMYRANVQAFGFAAPSAAPIESGQNEISVSVEVHFEILQ